MALYRKHRPQQFNDIVDQTHIITTLKNQITQQNIAHAYLFSGPRGIGKTTTARLLAKALNCTSRKEGDYEPCSKCDSCKEISEVRSIDVIEMDAASHTGVDNVRQNIIENSQFKPTKSKYKVFIIDEAHMLSAAAFNALLKTLEEPPEYIVFILATTDVHKLPITIISRCQQYTFKKVPAKELSKYLKKLAKKEKVNLEDEVIRRIILKSEGCVRDAIGLLDQLMAIADEDITEKEAELLLPIANKEYYFDLANALFDYDSKKSIELINGFAKEGVNIKQFTYDFINFLRSLMIFKIDPKLVTNELELTDEEKKRLEEMSVKTTANEIVQLIDLALKRVEEIKGSPIMQLPLEMLTIEWISTNQNNIKSNCSDINNNNLNNTDNGNDDVNTTGSTEIIIEEEVEVVDMPEKRILTSETTSSLKSKVKQLVSKQPIILHDDVMHKWDNFIEKLEEESPSLVFILKMAEIASVEDNIVKLAVEYEFHQEKLMEKSTKSKIEAILSELLDARVKVDIAIGEQAKKIESMDELQNLATAIGGEVLQ